MINWWERRREERNIIDNTESIAHCWQVTNEEPWVYQVLVVTWLEYVSWKAVQLHTSICCASQSRIVFYPFPLLSSFWKLIYSFTTMGMQQNLKIIHTLYRVVKYYWVNHLFQGQASHHSMGCVLALQSRRSHFCSSWFLHHLVTRDWCCLMWWLYAIMCGL